MSELCKTMQNGQRERGGAYDREKGKCHYPSGSWEKGRNDTAVIYYVAGESAIFNEIGGRK